MQRTKRFMLGLLSSALLAVGLVRAAGQLDPVSRDLPTINLTSSTPAPTCGLECDSIGNVR